jgi:hypothetical protein
MVDASSSEEEVVEHVRDPPEGPASSDRGLTYYKELPDPLNNASKALTRHDKARQRWKILCIVKTSDPEADETTRQEKLKERVDEWMSSMVSQMRVVDDEVVSQQHKKEPSNHRDHNFLPVNGLSESSKSSSGRSSPLVPKLFKDDELEETRRRTDLEQRKRIKQRVKQEQERERLLILQGKLKMTSEHLEDPVLRLHHDFKTLEKKAKKNQERKMSSMRSRRKISATSKAVKLKWTSAMGKLSIKSIMDLTKNDNSATNDEPSETVVANLVYDEDNDILMSPLVPGDDDVDRDAAAVAQKRPQQQPEHTNPVFQAFDDAKGVDDLYRIAEIWVNPATYYNLDHPHKK